MSVGCLSAADGKPEVMTATRSSTLDGGLFFLYSSSFHLQQARANYGPLNFLIWPAEPVEMTV